jgi:predicted Zn-dependent protease
MPLRVFLTPPPPGLFENSESIFESVRDGVLDWSEVVDRHLPSFVFVDKIGEADIPIVWATEPDCVYDIQPFSRRFGVARILVTGRWSHDRVADLFDIYATVLHEMGHALGLGGHSPDPSDIMYPSASRTATEGLSARDRATLRELYSRPIGARILGARHDP